MVRVRTEIITGASVIEKGRTGRIRGVGVGREQNVHVGRAAWALCLFGVILALLGQYWDYRATPPGGATGGLLVVVLFAAPSAVFGAMGSLILARGRSDRIGWLFCAQGIAWAVGDSFSGGYATLSLEFSPGSLPGGEWAALVNDVGFVLIAGFFALILLFFPTGEMPSARWTAVFFGIVAGMVGSVVGGLLSPGLVSDFQVSNPMAVAGAFGEAARLLRGPSMALILFGLLASFASVLVRMRRATGIERHQIKWFLFAAAVFISVAFFIALSNLFFPRLLDIEGPAGVMLMLSAFAALMALPVGAGIAILRYRLYDIDRIISRTLAYGLLTAVLAGGYFLGVLALQSILPLSDDSPLIVAASTLAVVAAFGPLRTRVKHSVDRRFNRSRYDAELTVETLGNRLRSEVEIDSLASHLVEVVDKTMAPAHISLWLREEPTT